MLTVLFRRTNLVVPEFWSHVAAEIAERVVLIVDVVSRKLCTAQRRCVDPAKLLLPFVHKKEESNRHADWKGHN